MRRMDLPCARRAGIGLALGVLAAVGCTRSSSKPTPTTTTTSPSPTKPVSTTEVLLGRAAFGDFTQDAPGLRRKITAADLPPPFATKSADAGSKLVARPPGALPRVPDGFKVAFFAGGLTNPRMARVAPNGDLFVVESKANRVRVLRDADGDGTPEVTAVFAEGLNQPFGVGFYPPDNPAFVYVANTDSVVRYPYAAGDTKARGPAEVLVNDISGGGRLRGGGHWTRDLVFSRDAKKMFVSVGSRSNVDDGDAEARRARIFEFTPDGKNERVYATGLRNAVGLAVHPITGELWASVNERDELGDDLVPDYITHVKDGGFYGWPWFYIGANQDPHHEGKHPELRDKVTVPDVLLQAHSASLGMTFTTGKRLPPEWRSGAFAAEHGSWNRSRRTGYKVIFVPVNDGVPTGEYVDFMTGFVLPNGEVWGRPVAVAQTKDGSLFVTDDGGDCVWLVTR
jgi:glucose/arabinose dehydrogenase